MVNDLLGGLSSLGEFGNIIGGLAKNPVFKDTGKLLTTQKDLLELQKKEKDLLIEIGRQAYEHNPTAWPQSEKLMQIQHDIAEAKALLDEAKQAREGGAGAQNLCQGCGHKNQAGVNFCQECGTKLGGASKAFCSSCGAELALDSRFCGGCGAKQGE